MKRATLICKCPSYRISEINRTFYKGDQLEVSEIEYKKEYLQNAIRLGVFSVMWKQECRMKKKPQAKKPAPQPQKSPPFVRIKHPPRGGVPQKQSETQVSEAAIRTVVRQEVSQLKKEIIGEVSNLLQQNNASNLEALTKTLSQVLANVPQGTPEPSKPQTPTTVVEAEDPVYIPSDITNSGIVSGGSMSVESISTEGSVTDAAAALRAMKKNRRNKK